jgi:hypothetical protein
VMAVVRVTPWMGGVVAVGLDAALWSSTAKPSASAAPSAALHINATGFRAYINDMLGAIEYPGNPDSACVGSTASRHS